jgi:hypothetical protein
MDMSYIQKLWHRPPFVLNPPQPGIFVCLEAFRVLSQDTFVMLSKLQLSYIRPLNERRPAGKRGGTALASRRGEAGEIYKELLRLYNGWVKRCRAWHPSLSGRRHRGLHPFLSDRRHTDIYLAIYLAVRYTGHRFKIKGCCGDFLPFNKVWCSVPCLPLGKL